MVIYLDNAATSWPKPHCVVQAMDRFMRDVGANPGRSGHRRSIEAGRLVYDTREAVAELFNVPDPLQVAFGANATEGLNLALRGLLRPGDHVVTSAVEHNSVMRPLRALEAEGVEVTVVPCAATGELDPADLELALRDDTALVVLNHASNVNGTMLPVAAVGGLLRERETLLLLDAAATAGAVPIDMPGIGVDLLAFTGHKHLYGPMGTGGLVVGDRALRRLPAPLKRGGTGSRSELDVQPQELPDLYESGTLNALGLAGLGASVRWLLDKGMDRIRAEQIEESARWLETLGAISGVRIQGVSDPARRIGVFSFTLEGFTASEVGLALDDRFDIMTRVGLHCAPGAHRAQGTFPEGTVRIAPSSFTTPGERRLTAQAIAMLAREEGP